MNSLNCGFTKKTHGTALPCMALTPFMTAWHPRFMDISPTHQVADRQTRRQTNSPTIKLAKKPTRRNWNCHKNRCKIFWTHGRVFLVISLNHRYVWEFFLLNYGTAKPCLAVPLSKVVHQSGGEDGCYSEKFQTCSVGGARSKNSIFRNFRVPFDYPVHSLQETVLP